MPLRDMISIHALREEGDPARRGFAVENSGISIHALREEGDPRSELYSRPPTSFLSTPSARRATKLPPSLPPKP